MAVATRPVERATVRASGDRWGVPDPPQAGFLYHGGYRRLCSTSAKKHEASGDGDHGRDKARPYARSREVHLTIFSAHLCVEVLPPPIYQPRRFNVRHILGSSLLLAGAHPLLRAHRPTRRSIGFVGDVALVGATVC